MSERSARSRPSGSAAATARNGRSAAGFDPIRFGLAAVNRIAQSPALDRFNLRKPTERVVFNATRTGFRTATAASRAFSSAGTSGPSGRSDASGTSDTSRNAPARLGPTSGGGLFDLTPTEEQQMLIQVVTEFAAEKVRPVAADADRACAAPGDVLATAAELGITQVGVPEEAGGLSSERTAVTNVLVAEALAYGDLGIAVSCLAPAAVSSALSLWGTAQQQETYLPALVGDRPPAAALTLLEPRAGFDPGALDTVALPAPGGGYRITGVKSLVPQAAAAELFLVAAQVPGNGPALFVVESGAAGLSVEAEPSMGLRAAGMGRLILADVAVPAEALIPAEGGGTDGASSYTECVRLSRLAWCALAVGTGQAVLDYVIPYVNEREAFGEPISNRQAVAFLVADIAIELDGMRLVTYRAAGRAEQGLSYAREVALARRLCADKGMFIGSSGVQLLGGHGYVKEHPVERWYRDLRAIGLMEGVVLV